jgi:putative ABC transport system permease protein
METRLQDFRYAWRTLRRAPGFAATAILTLALGIGAATALFSLVHGVLVRPLPYRDATRLVLVLAEQDMEGASRPVPMPWPAAALGAWPEIASVESTAFFSPNVAALASTEGTELVDSAIVSDRFFTTLDGALLHGRGFGPADDGHPVTVISERLWRRHFGGSADVLGQTLTVNGQAHTIIGVASHTLQVPTPQTDVWLTAGYARTRNLACCSFTAVARVKEGVPPNAAREDIETAARAVVATLPRSVAGARIEVISLLDSLVRETRPALVVLAAAVLLLLVLACANVMNLMLARNSARRRELHVRRALGASRGRIAFQSLCEAALVASGGAAAGAWLAAMALELLRSLAPGSLPRLDAVRLDALALLFAAVAALATTLAIGVFPAMPAIGPGAIAISAGQRSTPGGRTRTALRVATVVQLAISVVLVVGAVLLGRSLVTLMRTDIGVEPEGVVTASVNLAMNRRLSDAQQIDLVDRIITRITSLPQVTAAGMGAARPPDASRMRLTLNRSDAASARAAFQAAAVPATPAYFTALGMRLERGRWFTAADDERARPVVIMSADTARLLFGNEDPLGRTIELPVLRNGATSGEHMTVVGITANVKYSGLAQPADAVVYRPFAQQPWRSVFLVARTAGDAGRLASQLRREIAAVDAAVTVADVTPLATVVADLTLQPRVRTMLLIALAGMAITIAAVGLYGVIAYSVSQRTAEIGIRMALGADRRRIRLMVLSEGAALTAIGLAGGLAAALGGSRLIAALLFGIAPTDPASFALAAVVTLVVGLAAALLPAARAAGADPLSALKAE